MYTSNHTLYLLYIVYNECIHCTYYKLYRIRLEYKNVEKQEVACRDESKNLTIHGQKQGAIRGETGLTS